MSTILVVAETRHGAVREVTYELVAAATILAKTSGARVVVAVIDAQAVELAAEVARRGGDEVLAVPTGVERFDASVHQRVLETLVEEERPRLVLAAHSIDSFGFAPAVAAAAGLGFATDVVAVGLHDGAVSAVRGAYGEKLVADLAFPGRDTVLLLVRPGVYAAAEGGGDAAPVRVLAANETAPAVEHVTFETPVVDGVDIAAADFVLAIGRGVERQEDVARFAALADKLGATLAASRPLVDAGWCEPERQVGQSGRTVKPRVYLALGISGAVQHLAGLRDAETVIAVNSDAGAPIFARAEYGAVVDMLDLAGALEQLAD